MLVRHWQGLMPRVSYKNYRMMGFDCTEYKESIENMNEQIKRLDKKIEEYIKERPHLWELAQRLMEIEGMGLITADNCRET